MNYPRISVVTPSFNQREFIEETIDSVLSQKYPNLEYIIIDGGSTDGSDEVIKKYAKHLTYWVSESDKGHAHAINKGFSHATGDIMSWLNSDDKYFPWTFSAVSDAFLNKPEVEWLQGVHSWFDEKGRLLRSKSSYRNAFDFVNSNYQWIQQESVFWKRSLWEKSGGKLNENYRFMVDGELWSRFFLHAELFNLDLVVGGVRQHGTRRALNNENAVREEMERCTQALLQSYDSERRLILENILSRIKKFRLETGSGILPEPWSTKLRNKKKREFYSEIHREIEQKLGKAFSSYPVIRSSGKTFITEQKPLDLIK